MGSDGIRFGKIAGWSFDLGHITSNPVPSEASQPIDMTDGGQNPHIKPVIHEVNMNDGDLPPEIKDLMSFLTDTGDIDVVSTVAKVDFEIDCHGVITMVMRHYYDDWQNTPKNEHDKRALLAAACAALGVLMVNSTTNLDLREQLQIEAQEYADLANMEMLATILEARRQGREGEVK